MTEQRGVRAATSMLFPVLVSLVAVGGCRPTPKPNVPEPVTPAAVTPSAPPALAAAGGRHTCVLSKGAVFCVGDNDHGQLGDGTKTRRSHAVPVATAADLTFTQVAAGEGHSCALTTEGAAYCWGTNGDGQLGNGTTTDSSTPVRVVAPDDVAFIQVAGGATHTCAVSTTGAAYCWGRNDRGQLGTGDTANSSIPSLVLADGLTFTNISAGLAHSCGITNEGTGYCWGDNLSGELGTELLTSSLTPSAVVAPAGVFTQVVASGIDVYFTFPGSKLPPTKLRASTCGLTRDGAVYCWGDNLFHQVGGMGVSHPTPELVWPEAGVKFVQLTAGTFGMCAVTELGDVYCWGANAWGDGMHEVPTRVSTPPGVSFTHVTAGGRNVCRQMEGRPFVYCGHVCGVTASGHTYCWGNNDFGQLGTGLGTSVSPVAVAAPPNVTFTRVSAGERHTCALTALGTAYCWGDNHQGELGDGTQTPFTTPVLVAAPGVTFTDIWASDSGDGLYDYDHSCGLTTAGQVYCWGDNMWGELGDGTTNRRTLPVQTTGLSGVTFLSVGHLDTCALVAGAAHCWGLGYGQSPWLIPTLSGVAFIQVGVGREHACGLTATGETYCWTARSYGPVTPTPISVPTGVTFTQLTAGHNHTCALTPSGAAYCWGTGANPRPALVAAPAGVTFTQLVAGTAHSCALTASGAAYCWGSNLYGELGDGTTTSRAAPVLVLAPAGVSFTQITVSGERTCGISSAGPTYCWGNNGIGQLGTDWPDPHLPQQPLLLP